MVLTMPTRSRKQHTKLIDEHEHVRKHHPSPKTENHRGHENWSLAWENALTMPRSLILHARGVKQD